MKSIFDKSLIHEGAPYGNKNAAGKHTRVSHISTGLYGERNYVGITRKDINDKTVGYASARKEKQYSVTPSSRIRLSKAIGKLPVSSIAVRSNKGVKQASVSRGAFTKGMAVHKNRTYNKVTPSSVKRLNSVARKLATSKNGRKVSGGYDYPTNSKGWGHV